MRTTNDIRERIAVRAYFAWQSSSTGSAETNWLQAEAIETELAERRAAAATKAAATRRARTEAPAEMLVAVKSRPTVRPTAH